MENEKIGHFKILREIGSGGFGTVYLAYDEEIDEYAALKKVENFSERKHERRGIYYYKKNRENFRSENIISIHETIKFGDDMYYSMPIADGMGGVACSETNYTPKTLELAIKERLKQGGGWFSEDEILDIIIPIAKALAAVDKCGLKHRDVKPANIIFIKGKPMLSDFGLAAQDTSSLSRAGTADYTPPAWFADSGGDPDMWGFAMTFFALFSGKPPSESKNNRKYPKCWSEKDFLKNRGAWDKFAQIVFRVKNENESERFPNWDALLNALYKLRGFSDKYKNPAGKPANKRRLLNYFLYPAIALLLLAAMAFSIYSGGSPAIKEQAEARPEKPKANPENVKLVKDKINAEIERRTQIYKKELDSYKEKIKEMENKMRELEEANRSGFRMSPTLKEGEKLSDEELAQKILGIIIENKVNGVKKYIVFDYISPFIINQSRELGFGDVLIAMSREKREELNNKEFNTSTPAAKIQNIQGEELSIKELLDALKKQIDFNYRVDVNALKYRDGNKMRYAHRIFIY